MLPITISGISTFLTLEHLCEKIYQGYNKMYYWYYPREIRISSTNHSQFTRQWEEDPLHPQLVPVQS